jgi:putative transposase
VKGKTYSEAQIIAALKEHEAGAKAADVCRKLGIVENTFYRWKAKYGGMEVSEAKRLHELELENSKPQREDFAYRAGFHIWRAGCSSDSRRAELPRAHIDQPVPAAAHRRSDTRYIWSAHRRPEPPY